MIYKKIINRRTIRKYQRKEIPEKLLVKCVNAARLSPSGDNRQLLKYIIVNDQDLAKDVFTTLPIWAGHLKYKPNVKQMPSAYILILLDKKIGEESGHDAGIAAMSVSMVAYDEGVGSCIFGYAENKLKEILNIPNYLDIVLVIALGYPAEQPMVDKLKKNKTKFWLDEDGVLHVPKRKLQEIVKWNRCSHESNWFRTKK